MNLNCCQLLRFSITSSFFMQVEFLVLVLPKKKKNKSLLSSLLLLKKNFLVPSLLDFAWIMVACQLIDLRSFLGCWHFSTHLSSRSALIKVTSLCQAKLGCMHIFCPQIEIYLQMVPRKDLSSLQKDSTLLPQTQQVYKYEISRI